MMSQQEPVPVNDKILESMLTATASMPRTNGQVTKTLTVNEDSKNKPSRRYPWDAMTRIPSLECEQVDLSLYPPKSSVKKNTASNGVCDCTEITEPTDLTDTENTSFSWSDEEGFDLQDCLETQKVLESLGKEQRIEHFQAALAHKKSIIQRLDFKEPEATTVSPSTYNESSSSLGSKEDYGIEVSRGVFQELRGLKETYEALNMGMCTETSCLFCHMHLVCVQDADCVLCPQCHSVSPLEANPNNKIHTGGMGVGIFVE